MMKKIIFTSRADDRMRDRHMKKDWLISTISAPDYVVVRGEFHEAYKEIEGKLLKAVYIKKEKFIRIITLYWVNGNEAKDKV